MVDGNDEEFGFPLLCIDWRHRRGLQYWPCGWDSRECPEPISEATLHCPSASRALTAGAIALAVVTPAIEPVEQAAAALQVPLPIRAEPVRNVELARTGTGRLEPDSAFSTRATTAQRASRAAIRRAGLRPFVGAAGVRPAVTSATRRSAGAATHRTDSTGADPAWSRRSTAETRSDATHRSVRIRRARTAPRTVVRTRAVTRRTISTSAQRVRLGNMTAVIAYARSQVGARYVSGGTGSGGFDCSGLTKRAYARAGIRLPHSSRAQAARARRISRAHARPGDLVVGSGHVGIYMGRGMMIDAGNHRTGVVYRKLYPGLAVKRL